MRSLISALSLLSTLIICSSPANSGYLLKVIPALEISEGYESSNGKTVSRSALQSESITDTFTLLKPSLSLFYRPAKEIYINTSYTLDRQIYTDRTNYNNTDQSVDLTLNYAPLENLSIGASADYNKFKMDKFNYMDFKSVSIMPFAGIQLHERVDMTFSWTALRKKYEKGQFEYLKPFEEYYYSKELMFTYFFSRSVFAGIGIDLGKNYSNYSAYDYRFRAFSLYGKFKLLKKVKLSLAYRREKVEYLRAPTPYEKRSLFGLEESFILSNANTLSSARKDTADMLSLKIYSILNSWIKLSLDYSYVSNRSGYDWEEYESHVIFVSAKVFQRFKK